MDVSYRLLSRPERSTRVRTAVSSFVFSFVMLAIAIPNGAAEAMSLLSGTASDTDQDVSAEARYHFERGKALFEVGNFRKALREYTKAYELLPLPGLLFNIGQCHRNIGEKQKAIFTFRLYLQKKPNASNRAAVEALIRDLQTPSDNAFETENDASSLPGYNLPDRAGQKGTRYDQQDDQLLFDLSDKRRSGRERRTRKPKATPFYKSWWFWTGVAAVVAGGTVGTVLYFRARQPEFPESNLGILQITPKGL